MDRVEQVLNLTLGIGLQPDEMDVMQVALRAALIYIAIVLLVRLGKKRFMSGATAFDVILGVMLGSVASRAITGNAPLDTALAASATMIVLHLIISWIAVHSHLFGILVKGRDHVLVRDGRVDWNAVKRMNLSERDLMEALRSQGVARPEDVAEARMERSGHVSVVKATPPPKVVDVRVADGVQTVRIELA